jgi:zinc finger-containing ubiquitin peptidase 1
MTTRSRSRDQQLDCPRCRFQGRNIEALQQHIDDYHPGKRGNDKAKLQPDAARATKKAQLSDAELAQLLAFEEAGLPAELALPDQPTSPSTQDGESEEVATHAGKRSERNPEDIDYVQCQCGERVHVTELDDHCDMHAQENISIEDTDMSGTGPGFSSLERSSSPALTDHSNSFSTDIPRSLRNHDQLRSQRHESNRSRQRGPSLKDMFLGTSASPKKKSSERPSGRGTAFKGGRVPVSLPNIASTMFPTTWANVLQGHELGPYANERQMPDWLRKLLVNGAKVTITNRIGKDGRLEKVETIANETRNLVPVLARLSHLDHTVERAFYCHPAVRHICKMYKEGGFCGYRSIQMLISYIQDSNATGADKFPGKPPHILRLQELIEDAWDQDYNAISRIETGGILGTRKHIGTSEAQALFQSLKIPCEAVSYSTTEKSEAYDIMLYGVCAYFDDERSKENTDKVVITDKPPIYFQRPGHAMVIVGVEQRRDARVNLVVYDPAFNPSPALKSLAVNNNTTFAAQHPQKLLKAYRRDAKYLKSYNQFELLKLT